ncbi:hypothetical protein B0H63DRAFT_495050 [Podospora didyma]|uniref:Rhodopsin domain-containing protein n=1 Tax=Podospora didyma TaxID=330526 RepID=A0AAE0TVN0_9PEZI|nr:hypothetical protein B0H63DRAFT_495050 [Podospora didyma]
MRVEITAMSVVICIVITTRVLFKIFANGQSLWWEDYALMASEVVGIPQSIREVVAVAPAGVGHRIFQLVFVSQVFYFPQVALLKLSFLFFYLRIFPGEWTRRLIWGTIIFTVLYGIAFTLLAIFQCQPVSAWWVQWDGSHGGKCVSNDTINRSSNIVSIFQDVWMITIPLRNVWSMNMDTKKKLGVASIVTVISCVRVKYLGGITHSQNPTQGLFDLLRWSKIETFTARICACMPALRQMLLQLFPKATGSTNKSHLTPKDATTQTRRRMIMSTGLLRIGIPTAGPMKCSWCAGYPGQHGLSYAAWSTTRLRDISQNEILEGKDQN